MIQVLWSVLMETAPCDVTQGNVGDSGVEHHHERGDGHDHRDEPGAAIAGSRTGEWIEIGTIGRSSDS